MVAPCKQALKDANYHHQTLMKSYLLEDQLEFAIQEKVKEIFGKEPNQSVNPDEVVALGAAIARWSSSRGC